MPAFQDRLVGRAGIKFRARIGLQFRQAAGMIEMGVAVEQNFDIRQLEAQRFDIGFDLRHRFRQRAVGENMPSGVVIRNALTPIAPT